MDFWASTIKPPSNQSFHHEDTISLTLTSNDLAAVYEGVIQDKKEVDMKFDLIKDKLDSVKYETLRAIETQAMSRKINEKYNHFQSNYLELQEHRNHLTEIAKQAIRIGLDLFNFKENDPEIERAFGDKMHYLEKTLYQLENREIPEVTAPGDRYMFYPNGNGIQEGPKRESSEYLSNGKVPRLNEAGLSLASPDMSARENFITPASVPPAISGQELIGIKTNNSSDDATFINPRSNAPIAMSQSPVMLSTPQQTNISNQAIEPSEEGGRKLSLRSLSKTSSVIMSPITSGLKLLYTLPHGEVVSSIVTAGANADTIFTGGLGAVKVWESNNAQEFPTLTLKSMEGYIRACRVSPSGKILAVGGESDKIVLWDVSQSPPCSLACFPTTSEAIYAITFSQDSKFMFTCCMDGSILVWDVVDNKSVKVITGHSMAVTCLDVAPDGSYLISGSLDKTVRVWDLISYEQVSCCVLASPVFSLGLGVSGLNSEKTTGVIVAGLESGNISTISFDDMVHSKAVVTANHEIVSGHDGCITSLKLSKSRDRFLTTDKKGIILGWHLAPDGQSIYRLFMHREGSSILCSTISKDDTKFITGSGNKFASVYQLSWLCGLDSWITCSGKIAGSSYCKLYIFDDIPSASSNPRSYCYKV